MDTGLQFSKRGLDTLVLMNWGPVPPGDVVVMDTDCRDARASEARERAVRAARLLAGRRIYKKVDSTMRGNVGYELRGLAEVLGPRGIVVAPAFPRNGRTTLWGVQRVNDYPLELTPFAHDPRWPMRESHLPTLLMQQSGYEVGLVSVDVVSYGSEAVAAALRDSREPIVVVDALTQSHLRALAEALVQLGPEWLPCGSAGLAEEWAEALGLRRERPQARPQRGTRPVLAVCGSRHEATRRQLERAVADLGLPCVELESRQAYDAERETERLVNECVSLLARGQDVVLTASLAPLIAGGGELVARILSSVTAAVVARLPLAGLFLTGGDIAVASCRALQTQALRVAQELQPGIPGGQLVAGRCDGWWVVTKAGGFGDQHALVQAVRYLHGERV